MNYLADSTAKLCQGGKGRYVDREGVPVNAGQVGLGSSRPESSRPDSSRPGPILTMVGMCLIKRSFFNKSWSKDV